MKKWTIKWKVDGSTGESVTKPCTLKQAKEYFYYQFAVYGYRLLSIE